MPCSNSFIPWPIGDTRSEEINMETPTTLVALPTRDELGSYGIKKVVGVKGNPKAVLNRARAEAECELLDGVPPANDGAGRLNGADATMVLQRFSIDGGEMDLVPWNRCMRPPSAKEAFGEDVPAAPEGVTELEIQVAYNQHGLPIITAAVGGWIGEQCDDDGELVQPETWMATSLSKTQADKLQAVMVALLRSDIATKHNAVTQNFGLSVHP